LVAGGGGQLPQGSNEVVGVHSPHPKQLTAARFVQPGTGAGHSFRFTEGFNEWQVLQGVQGIVMDEIAQRRLRRQEVGDVPQAGLQPLQGIARRRAGCFNFRRCWRTHSDSEGSGQLGQRRGHQPEQRCRIEANADDARAQQPGCRAFRALEIGEMGDTGRDAAERPLGPG
jgi:hypothetical protein